MLELRPTCENCNKPLPNESAEAMICSFECTFCADCVVNVLHNVCPNCGGGFERRPTRPAAGLGRHPASTKVKYKPVDMSQFITLLEKNKGVDPKQR